MSDQRLHERLLARVRVYARIESTPDGSIPRGTEFVCETRDLSFKGVCLVCEGDIPEKSVLILNVELDIAQVEFNHVGEVIWQRRSEQGFLIGVQITEHLCEEKVWQDGVMTILTS